MLQLKDKPRDIKMWDRFLELGPPERQNEVYRYVRLKELYSHCFGTPKSFEGSLPQVSDTLVFVNGSYCSHLSEVPKPLIALPLSEAFKIYGNFLNPRLQKHLNEEKDPFALVNGAYYMEGLFVYLPPKTRLEKPLKIIHLSHGLQETSLLCPRIHIFCGKESQAQFFISQKIAAEAAWVNFFVDFALEERSHLSFTSLSNTREQGHDFLALRATLKSGSVFKGFGVTNGGATSRQDYILRFLGPQAEGYLYGLWNLKKNRQHHVNVLMDHQEPGCISQQKFKGILSEAARSSFEGKIYVHQQAQKTEAYQMNHNLILGSEASANVKPNLEVFADDVKASHGATVGQLDQEHFFYLRSRGLSFESAKALLVQGFSQEIIELINCSAQKKEALEIIS